MISNHDILPPPSDFGLPAKFNKWRPNQPAAVIAATTTERPYVGLVAPTGFGKSIVAEVIAALNGGRSCYTVVTKALADQLERDFPDYRFDVRGKSNYDCKVLQDNGLWGSAAKCDKAEHLCDACVHKDRGCHYFDAWRTAKWMERDKTNYAYWLAINKHNEEGIGAFNTLILDEAHNAPDQLSASLRIELQSDKVEKFTRRPLPGKQPIDKWREWASNHIGSLQAKLDAHESAARVSGARPSEARELKYLVGAVKGLQSIAGDWIEDRSTNTKRGAEEVGFEPIWPGPYVGELIRSTPHTLLMSATIRPKTLQLLGLPADQTTFLEYPSSFPVERRPVIHINTVQMRRTMQEDQKREWVRRIDQIIDRRDDRKGLIHTNSFDYAEYIFEHSRHRKLMMLHQRGTNAATWVERHHAMKPESGALLISPSIDEGYDFADDLARYQIIAKVPFLYSGSPILKARMDADDEYGNYAAMITLIQMCGRIVRSATDWGETLIVDDQFVWFYFQCVKSGFVPGWFQPAVRVKQVIPKPLYFAAAA